VKKIFIVARRGVFSKEEALYSGKPGIARINSQIRQGLIGGKEHKKEESAIHRGGGKVLPARRTKEFGRWNIWNNKLTLA
jgi:hypothetical protein